MTGNILPPESGGKSLVPQPAPVRVRWIDHQSQGVLILLALLGSNFFALFIGSIYEFLGLRGVVNLTASRIVLVAVWIMGGILSALLIWAFGVRARVRTFIATVVPVGILLYGLDLWAPKPTPIVFTDDITTELTIDRSLPAIRQVRYASDSDRRFVEINASNWLAKSNPLAFGGQRNKVTRDLVVFSLVSFLRSRDAQLWEGHYHAIGSLLHFEADPNRKCALVSEADLRSQFHRVGNLYVDAPLFTMCCNTICLPLGSTLKLTSDDVLLKSEKYSIVFIIEDPSGVNFQDPRNGDLTKLPDGYARFETRGVGIEVRVTYFRLHLNEAELSKYEQWAGTLIRNAKLWFSMP